MGSGSISTRSVKFPFDRFGQLSTSSEAEAVDRLRDTLRPVYLFPAPQGRMILAPAPTAETAASTNDAAEDAVSDENEQKTIHVQTTTKGSCRDKKSPTFPRERRAF